MRIRDKVLPAVCCISMLGACASNRPQKEVQLPITPMTKSSMADNATAMYEMGRYYQGQNRYDLAISAYQKSLAANNNFVEARNGLGVIYAKQGKYRDAIDAFQQAIKQAPNAAYIYSNMGYAYYLQGKYAASVKALEQASLLDPVNQLAVKNLALANAKAGSIGDSVSPMFNVPVIAHQESEAEMFGSLPQLLPLAINAQTTINSQIKSVEVSVLGKVQDVPKVSIVESQVQLVQLAPNVSELRVRTDGIQANDVKPIKIVQAIGDTSQLGQLKFEVSNGNGVNGMASKVSTFLRSQGYSAARLTNQKPFQMRMTQIQYRHGHQAEAQLLQSSLPELATLNQRDDLRADISVRLVLGKDLVTKLTHFDGKWHRYQLAGSVEVSGVKSVVYNDEI